VSSTGGTTGRPMVLAGGDLAVLSRIGRAFNELGNAVVLLGDGAFAQREAGGLPAFALPAAGSLPSLVERITSEFGVPRAVVSFPGSLPQAAACRLSRTDWTAAFETELLAPSQLWNAFVPAMAAVGSGSVVALITPDVVHGYPRRALHAAFRSALVALVGVLAVEAAPFGVRANLLLSMFGLSGEPVPTRARIPTGSPPSEADIVAAILFLVDDATFMTGQALRVDGGWTAVDWALEPALVAPIDGLED
jgi:NAD(P)-dependent dehydrogenase (short-subunit alcohol dehydrogenase family)